MDNSNDTGAKLRQTVGAYGDLLSQFVFPIFIRDRKGIPRVVGTGFIVHFDGHFYLLTAAHVLDHIASGHRPFFYAETSIIYELEIGGSYFTSAIPPGGRKNDTFDVGVMRLLPEIGAKMKLKKILHWKYLSSESEWSPTCIYIVAGFPTTKTKADKRSKYVDPTALIYWNEGPDIKTYESLKLPEKDHILIRYDRKRSIHADGTQGIAPDPHGMSGAPIWRVKLDDDPKSGANHSLIGILTEHRALQKCFLGTHIRQAIAPITRGMFDSKMARAP